MAGNAQASACIIDGNEVFSKVAPHGAQVSRTQLLVELADVLFALEKIVLRVNPVLEAEYARLVGPWDERLLAAELAAKRQVAWEQLVCRAVKEGASVDPGQLIHQIDEGLAGESRMLETMAESHAQALSRWACVPEAGRSDSREADRVFREIVGEAHPVLHPRLSREGIARYAEAQRAYARGDILSLIELRSTLRLLGAESGVCHDVRSRLDSAIGELNRLRRTHPYDLRLKLSDDAWVAKQVGQLEEGVRRAELECTRSRQRLQRFLDRSA